MIFQSKQQYYLAVIKLSALFKRIKSKNNADFCCLNSFHSFRAKRKLQLHQKPCRYCGHFDAEMLRYYYIREL